MAGSESSLCGAGVPALGQKWPPSSLVAGVLSLAALGMQCGCALPQRARRSLEPVRQCWSYIAYMDFTTAMVTCKRDCEALPAGEYEAQSGLERVLFYFKHGPGRPRANR